MQWKTNTRLAAVVPSAPIYKVGIQVSVTKNATSKSYPMISFRGRQRGL